MRIQLNRPMSLYLALLLGTLGFWAAYSHSAEPDKISIGSIAPNWLLNDTQGNPVSLYQQSTAGNTTVMVFWASWCQKCTTLLPSLRKLQAEKQHQPNQIFIMNVWEDETTKAVQEIEELTVLVRADNVARRFGIGTTPGIVVVGPDRRIIYKRASGTSMEEVVTSLTMLLNQKQPATEKTTKTHP